MATEKKFEKELNVLLSTYQLHYQNLRSLHWNIKGENFFELHTKYEEWYTRTAEVIDEIAERLLTLEMQPISSYSGYLKESKIKELPITHVGKKGVEYVLAAQKTLLEQERIVFSLAAEKEDEGSSALMSDLIREKEKEKWMLKAWLGK